MTFSGWVATLAGWYVTEIGRQPWLVSGVLTTADAASDVAAPVIAGSLAMYLATYAVLITAYVATLFYLARKVAAGERLAPTPALGGAAAVPAE
jgi:cytochrome d ubiquinol oxidase subunit I